MQHFYFLPGRAMIIWACSSRMGRVGPWRIKAHASQKAVARFPQSAHDVVHYTACRPPNRCQPSSSRVGQEAAQPQVTSAGCCAMYAALIVLPLR